MSHPKTYGENKFETWLLHLNFLTSNNLRVLTEDLRKLSENFFAITTFQIHPPHIINVIWWRYFFRVTWDFSQKNCILYELLSLTSEKSESVAKGVSWEHFKDSIKIYLSDQLDYAQFFWEKFEWVRP